MSVTLKTQEMDKRHTTLNIAEKLENVVSNQEIQDKVTTIITDNVTNLVNAILLLSSTTYVNIWLNSIYCNIVKVDGIQSTKFQNVFLKIGVQFLT